jgi:hypothetical protein
MTENAEKTLAVEPARQQAANTETIAYVLYLWAIVGGLLPSVLNRYLEGAEAYQQTLLQFTSISFLCWLLAGTVFSLLAAHISSPKTLIQAILIGMSAPALLGGMVANQRVNTESSVTRLLEKGGQNQLRELPPAASVPAGARPTADRPVPAGAGLSWASLLMAPAYAAEQDVPLTKHGGSPSEGVLSNVLPDQGGNWYVFVASSQDEQVATDAAVKLRRKGVDARVLQPSGSNPYYGVAVGSNLKPQDAEKVLDSAQSRINPGAYVWKAPSNGPAPVLVAPAGR